MTERPSSSTKAAYKPEPLVYVAGLPDWPVDIAVTGSVWREGEPTPFLVKPNNEVALYVVRVVNEHEEREYADE